MNVLKIAISCVTILCLAACADRDVDGEYFNGEVLYFDTDSTMKSSVESQVAVAENYGYGMFAVHDSLVICWSPRLPNHFFRISNVDTGKELGQFCNQGRGPQDFISVGAISQFFSKSDDLMTLAYDSDNDKVFFWNISKSLLSGTTIFDTVISIDSRINGIPSYRSLFYQGEDRLLAVVRTSVSSETRQPFSDYQQRTIYSDELLRDYEIYNKDKKLSKGSDKTYVEELFYSTEAIKPDGAKIVQAMMYLPQINIVDIGSGKVIGCRMKDGVDFSVFQDEVELRDRNVYYNSVQADDEYIYATYWGQKQWDVSIGAKMPMLNTIHVFDWDGNFVRELKADRAFFRISLDQVRNRLYTADFDTDKLYYLDLHTLYDLK